jgi:hypothetical integral membrane protein (TIGR02206 family)
MGIYQTPVVIDPFSTIWWQCIIAVAASIVLIVSLPFYWKKLQHKNYAIFIAIILLINTIVEQWYNIHNGFWNLQQSIPGHLCSISNILCIFLLFNYKQWLAECIYYWGLLGGIHAILTPELVMGNKGYNFFSYFISHGGLILVVVYMIKHMNFKPRRKSWLWVLGYTQIIALGVGIFNYAVNANYMFLRERPLVNNPLIIGEWPYYIIVFELMAVLHFGLFYLPFAKKNRLVAVSA